MARAALNWDRRKLAAEAKLAYNTVLFFELGRKVRFSSIDRLQTTLEGQGVRFGRGKHAVELRA